MANVPEFEMVVVGEPPAANQPERETCYYCIMLQSLMKAYDLAAMKAREKKDDKREMFYLGKRDGITEALTHHAELTK